VIIFTKNRLNISGGIIITGSQNPPEINGLRFLSKITYVNNYELKEIRTITNNLDFSKYKGQEVTPSEDVNSIYAISEYLDAIYSRVQVERIKENNDLKVVIDTGAGTTKFVIPELLKELGCEVKLINNEFIEGENFPRRLDLIKNNLKGLMKKVWEEKADLGIAYDINGHRLRIIGDDYKCYPKDISLALIADHYANLGLKPCYLVTNISSSLRLDILTEEYDIKLVKTAIGEFFLALKIHSLMKEYPNAYIFGGEGSNGGVMIPKFNNTRDAIFATVKIIELLQGTNKKISSLVNEFPDYHKYTENINIEDINVTQLITKIKQELRSEGEKVFQMGNDLRIDNENESFTLIHPSTTEPVIRIIAEAKRKSLARILSQTTAELIRMILKTNE
jgi:phosphomannomutase